MDADGILVHPSHDLLPCRICLLGRTSWPRWEAGAGCLGLQRHSLGRASFAGIPSTHPRDGGSATSSETLCEITKHSGLEETSLKLRSLDKQLESNEVIAETPFTDWDIMCDNLKCGGTLDWSSAVQVTSKGEGEENKIFLGLVHQTASTTNALV